MATLAPSSAADLDRLDVSRADLWEANVHSR